MSARSLGLTALVAVALAVATIGAPAATSAARTSTSPFGHIRHVVVIMQENRSFDETLGDFCQTAHRCDGYVGDVRLSGGAVVPMRPSPDVVNPDVWHTVRSQVVVMDGGKMNGWDQLQNCISNGQNRCLTYYSPQQIPALTAYANKYVVSDHTFSMYDSPSWGGHMYEVAATMGGFTGDIPANVSGVTPGPGWGCDSNRVAVWVDSKGRSSMQPSCIPAAAGTLDPSKYPYGGAFRATKVPHVPTIMDRLDAKGLSWKVYATSYYWSICPSFGGCLYTKQRHNLVDEKQFFTDAAGGKLPAFALVSPGGPGRTDQHPPSSMLTGDNWIAKLVNAIQASPDWSSTAVFLTYDDCGCFYDHVPPGRNPDGSQQGPRLPMVIMSPYAKLGATDSHPATLASMLHFSEEAFGLAPLSVNDAQAYDYANAFNYSQAPTPGRVWPAQQPIPQSTIRQLAKLPPEDFGDDPT